MATQYRIGEFAYLGGVSAKTLRFYDEIGLLRPASVDVRTGYRQYRPEQLEELASIVSLKSLGLPLADVRSQLNGAGSRKDRRDLLRELKRSIEQSMHRATRSLQYVDATLEELDVAKRSISVGGKNPPDTVISAVRAEVKK